MHPRGRSRPSHLHATLQRGIPEHSSAAPGIPLAILTRAAPCHTVPPRSTVSNFLACRHLPPVGPLEICFDCTLDLYGLTEFRNRALP